GRQKCGLAVVEPGGRVRAREIVPTAEAPARAADWARRLSAPGVVVGHGTGGRAVCQALRSAGLRVETVPETGTTLAARALYFAEHPPRGWRRLVPRTLQLPPVPLDDYAAVLIARAYLANLDR